MAQSESPEAKSPAPSATALTILHAEHESIAAVLITMRLLVRQVRDRVVASDAKAFRAMLYYLDVFPEREHHRKEESELFARIRARTHEADAVLAGLTREHESGQGAIRELEQSLLRLEEGGGREAAAFVHAVERYVDGYIGHMRQEECELFPLAERVLTAQDWAEIAIAFGSRRDPLDGITRRTEYEQLLTRIANLVPAPLGFGSPSER
jgi:hemerythrin-like domain-containing protein